MYIYDLKTNHQKELLGLDTAPWFSWKIGSEEENTSQTACRIVVKNGGETVWDTGMKESGESAFIAYGGAPLRSRTRYTVEVTVRDNHENEASASSWFETAFLKKKDWKAKWIESPFKVRKRKKGFGNQPAATMFRRTFYLPDDIISARLYATAHGIYEASVNGQKVDDRLFAPEYSTYDKILFYQTYDVTELLRKGNNALTFTVADGWYFCVGTTMSKKTAAKPHALLYQMEIRTAGGRNFIVCSDGSEKAAESPVRCSDLFAGEMYDANQEIEGWDRYGFDDSACMPAKVGNDGYENLAAQVGEPARGVKELPAVNYYISPKGEQILDFGQVLSGHVRFRADLPAGRSITLEHFEITDTEGNYFNNILGMAGVGEGCDQKVVFVSAGKEAVYEAKFSFHGFRYVRVSGPDKIDPADFTAVAVSTDKAETGTFTCSDPRLVRLYENTRWSQRSNMFSIPTDCPQREKAGWTGDIGIYATTSLLNEDTTAFLTRWLRSVALDQQKDGAVPIVVPLNQTYKSMYALLKLIGGGKVGAAGWGDACILVPLAMYEQTGNTVILEECYPMMRKWAAFILKTAKKRGNKKIPKEVDQNLWNTGFHFGEWLIPSRTTGGLSDANTMKKSIAEGKLYVPEIYGVLAMRNLSRIAKILGKEEDAAFYAEKADVMQQAFADGVISRDGKMPVDVMGAYILPLHYGLVPEKHEAGFKEEILRKIEENGGCLDTGFLATPVLLDTLCECGYPEKAYDLLFQTKCPSWLYEVENGATTIWESWITTKPDGTPLNVSLNHYAFGCVDDWMFRTICGIVPTSPGYKTFRIAPVMDPRLTSAARTFETEYGQIRSEWTVEGGTFNLKVTVPPCTEAEICLPSGENCVKGSGTYEFSCSL